MTDTDLQEIKSILTDGSKSIAEIAKCCGWDKSQTQRLLGYLIREEKVVVQNNKYSWK